MKFLHLPFISRIQCLKEFQNTKCLPVFHFEYKKNPHTVSFSCHFKDSSVFFPFFFSSVC